MIAHDETPAGLSAPGKALLLLAVLVAGGLRWHQAVLEDYIKPDETVYVHAAELWSAGKSPYEESIFFYPPVFAWAASELTDIFGTLGYLKIQRASSLMGICLATWLAVVIAAWRWWPALLLSVAWLWLSPVVALPMAIGNATGLSTALTLACLCFWLRQPIAAGSALGLGQALKPIAPLAALYFLAYRQGANPRRAFQTGAASLVAGGLLLLVGLRYLPGMLANATGSGHQPYNFSLHRVLAGFGVPIRPVWIVAIVGLTGLWWIARQRLSKLEFLVAVLVLNLFAAPILWAHSLLLFLPVQLLAVAQIIRSDRSIRSGALGWRATLPHIVAGLAIASTVLSASIGGLAAAPAWIQSAVLTVPLLSLPYLGAYVLGGLRTQRRLSQPE